MSGSSGVSYRPAAVIADIRHSAMTYWRIAFALVLAWVAAIVLAPVAVAAGIDGVSQPVYHFFGYVCHQLPERSFHIFGHQFAVCSRCFGVYFGLLAGMLIYPFVRPMDESDPLPRFWLFASMVPIAADWGLGMFGVWENTFFTRFSTGLLLGIGCAVFIVPALVEIAEIRISRARQIRKAA